MDTGIFMNASMSMTPLFAVQEKNISYKDLAQTLAKIKSNIVSETERRIVPIKKSVQKLCDKLEYDPSDFQSIMPQEK